MPMARWATVVATVALSNTLVALSAVLRSRVIIDFLVVTLGDDSDAGISTNQNAMMVLLELGVFFE